MSEASDSRPSIASCVSLACAWEVLASKPGNVRPGNAFDDATVADFVTSGVLIGEILGDAGSKSIGELILESVEATTRWAPSNTNLGLILLLAPMAKAASNLHGPLDVAAMRKSLAALGPNDAALVYRAILLANPGGLGESEEFDVRQRPPRDLMAAMAVAASRDSIAREYCEGFPIVFEMIVPRLRRALNLGKGLSDSIVRVFLEVLSDVPDSLIGRKCGRDIADLASQKAGAALRAIDNPTGQLALSELDAWLRGDGNQRNPGTTADLIGAGLFAALRNGVICPPLRW